VRVAALPFLSHRYAVRAAEVMFHEFAEHALDYSSRVAEIVSLLTADFTPDAVNVVMAHGTLLGGRRGGGERDVQTSLDYELPASMFPGSAHYVALGHLHRRQEFLVRVPSITLAHRWPSTSARRRTSLPRWWSPPSPAFAPMPLECGSPAVAA